jgi:SAM-dependent methyltransferase
VLKAALDILAFNRAAWGRQVEQGKRWSVPVSPEVIAEARAGRWSVILTPEKAVPRAWIGELSGRDVLALASAGGQQACVLAAAGANVTVLDLSPAQLGQDRLVAGREGLALRFEEGDMRDLSRFPDRSFDFVFHPCSNTFVPDVRPVWRECSRVLKPGGRLLAGIVQPFAFLFDDEAMERGELLPIHRVPYSDLESRSPEHLERMREQGEALAWSHTLDEQIGALLESGFALRGLYEDGWPGHALAERIKPFLAMLAVRD